MFRRSAALALTLMVGMSSVAFAAESAPAPAVAKAEVKGVKVTLGKVEGTTYYMAMMPKVVVIKAGETVTWVNESGMDPHTVTVLADKDMSQITEEAMMTATVASGGNYAGGFLNSGMLMGGDAYTVTFDKPGAYNYLCLFHPNMTGTVVVLPADAPAASLEQRQQEVAAEVAAVEAATETAEAHLSAAPALSTLNADGTRTWTVNLGGGTVNEMFFKFFPSNLRIAEGDTVKWVVGGHFMYTIGLNLPADFQFMGPNGPTEQAMTPVGGPLFDGIGMVTSGMLAGESMFAPPGTPSEFQLTFTQTGTYKVVDYSAQAFGLPAEMTVTVAPKGALTVLVNGKELSVDYKGPHFHDGTVYVPFRAVAELLGAKVSYDAATGTADAVFGAASAEKQGESKVYINGKAVVAAHEHDGRYYVPAHLFASFFGGQAQFDAATGVMQINVSNGSTAAAAHNH